MQINPPATVLIEPRDYRSFCFRGEGRANFVISARHRVSGVRIVWRFAKARKSGLMTVKARSELVNSYMERIVAPFFSDQYLVDMNIVEFDTVDVHQLAKIPSLPANQKIEKFEDLFELPDEYSFFPLNTFQRVHGSVIVTNPKRLTSLQMLDATQLPMTVMDSGHSSTITVEIKPKQGFFQRHPNVDVPHCNNCILQIEKSCGQSHFSEMYDFCPLDLFSGNYCRMQKAIHSLFLVPHRNLRIFVDGNQVHSDEKPLEEKMISEILFPRHDATSEDLISALCLALSGNHSKKKFRLRNSSVLGQILRAQKVDEIGIIQAHAIYETMDNHVKTSLLDKSALTRAGLELILEQSSHENEELLQQLRRYFLAATMKDCSIMISLRRLNSANISNSRREDVVRLPNGLLFAFSIKIVDLDPKTAKNLVNSHARFMSGIKIIRLDQENVENERNFKPCI
ncbi:Inositol-pentakisphosphate 2-kinase [Caenorhabditis elegans]|uniref:Inositol-pentakisphosphate 2-kinase n=1 Tax=Caenorhabditis elegans TaxID=6239 RepID=Q9XXI1_CAEEL|nr:Inositol-pentakisphosphate 2-kinase [Caenorhabditis elegans]CAA19460.2 Inositol-pentakisphosphate 2-kinase [Caenorhabditis elegans]|eukprot:NP_496564.2 Inositol-pentakisphosphate 2-kinase [Caenorhabditis elegans]